MCVCVCVCVRVIHSNPKSLTATQLHVHRASLITQGFYM